MGLQRRDSRGQNVQPGGAPPKLKVGRGADGKLKVTPPEGEPTHTETVGEERPPTPDDPRSAYDKNVGGPNIAF